MLNYHCLEQRTMCDREQYIYLYIHVYNMGIETPIRLQNDDEASKTSDIDIE